jgi:hypothetical protein
VTQTIVNTTSIPAATTRISPSPTTAHFAQVITNAPLLSQQQKSSPTGTQSGQPPSSEAAQTVSISTSSSGVTIVSPIMIVTSTSKVLIAISFLLLCGVLITGILRRKKTKNTKKSTMPLYSAHSIQTNVQEISLTPPQSIDEVFLLKTANVDSTNNATWVLLTSSNRQIYGYYHGVSPKEGFVKVSGVRKIANGREYIDITDIKSAA